ncbi:MAG: DUF1573 domain-containing protein [Bacteroides sp.]|nr:DUF1573 domain-containing protein [Bacteroides sp.]
MSLCAQQVAGLSREQIDSIVNPPLLESQTEILRFNNDKLHIGTLSETDSPRSYTFTFRNVSTSTVSITRVHTSCGCTLASFDKQPIAPGAESSIKLTYNPKGRVGTVDARAFVYTTVSEKSPIAKLTLLGNVSSDDEWNHLPYSLGTLKAKRKQITITVNENGKTTERILCGNAGTTPLRLSAPMLPLYVTFRCEPEVLQPGQEGDLVITIDGTKLSASSSSMLKFSMLLEGIKVRPTDRTIKVTVQRTTPRKE